MTTWNRGWVYSRHVVTTFPPLSMFLRTVKMKRMACVSSQTWTDSPSPFSPSLSDPPLRPLTLAWPLLFITIFFCVLCTQMHTHWQTEDTHIHIHLSLSFLNKQGHFNYLSFFWPSQVISLHLCHLVVSSRKICCVWSTSSTAWKARGTCWRPEGWATLSLFFSFHSFNLWTQESTWTLAVRGSHVILTRAEV